MKRSIVLILVAICLSATTRATTRLVPGTYSTIQSALNACQATDTVLVSDGVYYGSLNWPQVNRVVLASVNGKEATFIDGASAGSVITLSGNVIKLTATINGFTIQNGLQHANAANGFVAGGSGLFITNMVLNMNSCNLASNELIGNPANFTYCNGAAINAENSKLNINYCGFTENKIDSTYVVYGGVIYVANTQLNLSNSTFNNNSITSASNIQGGVIAASFGQVIVKAVAVTLNEIKVTGVGSIVGGSYYLLGDGVSQFTNALIAGNSLTSGNTIQGGGIWSSFATSLIHCTIAGNYYSSGSGVGGNSISLNSYNNNSPKLKVINSILWNPQGSDFEMAFVGIPSVSYCDIHNGFSGVGNIASDPMFFSDKDYHLQNASSCLGRSALAANPPSDLDGNKRPMPAGTNADLGCYEVNQPLRVEDETNYTFGDPQVNVYPNPVHRSATISFLLDQESNVNVSVIDFSGRMLMQVANENLTAGAHELKLNSDRLTTGDYFVQMRVGDKIFNQKITVD